MAAHLRRVTFAGAADRFGTPVSAKVRAQLDRELELITRLGFCGYFLIVWELVQWAKARGIFCQGRGSAANSAVCYALGITNVDPIRQDLLFERFLSEGRNSWPDIDIDFPSGDQRESVIQEVYRRFGPRGAAMTANVITYRGRSAMREMSKVLGIPAGVAFTEESTCWNPVWGTPTGAAQTTTIGDLTRTAVAIGTGRLLSEASYHAMTDSALLGFGERLASCAPSCLTQVEGYNDGLGVVRSGGGYQNASDAIFRAIGAAVARDAPPMPR